MTTELIVRRKRLHDGQKSVYGHPARYKVVNCGRRWGKTTLAINIIIRRLSEGQRVAYFAPIWKQTSEVWRELKRRQESVIVYKNESERRLETMEGGVLDCWSLDSENSVRGRSYHMLIVDEAAMIANLEAIWTEALSPLLTDTEGSAYFFSTPKGHNYFHTLYMIGLDPIQVQWQAWNFKTVNNEHINPQEVANQRAMLPDRAFRQEYLAEFLDDAGGVFRGVDAVSTLQPAEPVDGHTYVFGVDWARDYDFTVISVFDATERKQVWIERFNEIDWPLQRGRLQTLAEKFNPSNIVAEENSFGSPNIVELQRSGLPVTPFKTTSASKAPLIEAFALAIEKQDVQLLDDPIQKAELKAYQMERTAAGNWKYNAPAGGHDDTVIAGALGWHGVPMANFILGMSG